MMDREKQKYFENYYEMFGSEGWKQFTEEMQAAITDHANRAFSSDDSNFYEVKGAIQAFGRVAGFENLIRQAAEAEDEQKDGEGV